MSALVSTIDSIRVLPSFIFVDEGPLETSSVKADATEALSHTLGQFVSRPVLPEGIAGCRRIAAPSRVEQGEMDVPTLSQICTLFLKDLKAAGLIKSSPLVYADR